MNKEKSLPRQPALGPDRRFRLRFARLCADFAEGGGRPPPNSPGSRTLRRLLRALAPRLLRSLTLRLRRWLLGSSKGGIKMSPTPTAER